MAYLSSLSNGTALGLVMGKKGMPLSSYIFNLAAVLGLDLLMLKTLILWHELVTWRSQFPVPHQYSYSSDYQ